MRVSCFAVLLAAGCECALPPPNLQYCTRNCGDAGAVDAGSSEDGGCFPTTCSDLHAECGFLDVGCGLTLDCGGCTSPLTCAGTGIPNHCGLCIPQTAIVACAAAGAECGSITVDDGCGNFATHDCGGCMGSELCADNLCCTPPDDAIMCSTAGFSCGEGHAIDRCGQPRTMSCGMCGGTDSCQATDEGMACAPCAAEDDATFCDSQGANCGEVVALDNCGRARDVQCGGCEDGGLCGAGAVKNQCDCQQTFAGCLNDAQCCSGACGAAGRCCIALNAACNEDVDCCVGSCVLGFCAFYDGGVHTPDDGGQL